MNPLAIIQMLTQIVGAASTLIPEIEKSISSLGSLSSEDLATARKHIADLHAQSQALTAQLDALKD